MKMQNIKTVHHHWISLSVILLKKPYIQMGPNCAKTAQEILQKTIQSIQVFT